MSYKIFDKWLPTRVNAKKTLIMSIDYAKSPVFSSMPFSSALRLMILPLALPMPTPLSPCSPPIRDWKEARK